ncbi:hypothetical protein SGFS_049280 [Streptomyces graminofaciens]|uniref:Integral membrane protein n=1 Tax=Streptomyces graminofaciens TaxID=68212 RepID=A0ABM8HKY6_9ACTN|nr:hypothetical protein [Streptomyces graminofaciens]BBC33634.1 hypothetical protein SGFS_049280 [Streptomyces graminofaciens]
MSARTVVVRARTWVLLFAGVFALLQLAGVTGRATPDTKNYVSYALSLRGDGKRAAAAATIEHYCVSRAANARRDQSVDVVRFHAPDPARRVAKECRRELWQKVDERLAAGQTGGHTVPFAVDRFQRIFEARPGYPVLLVPFVTVFGVTWGVWLASVLIAAAGGVLAFLVLRAVRAPTAAALAGQALYYVLPCGTTAMRPMTEGLLLALTLAALWGCALALEGRVRAGAALVGTALVLLFTVKHSQALFLGVCLVGACAAIAVRRRRIDPAVRAIGAVAAWAVVCTLLAAKLLHYPSAGESVQDLLTHHFAHPDRARPLPEFLQLEFNFWVEWSRRQFAQPLFLAALAAGAWGVGRQRPAFAAFVVAAACTGVLNQAGHPDLAIWGGRLIVLAWLLPVLGLPLLWERVRSGTPPGAGSAAVPEQAEPEPMATR